MRFYIAGKWEEKEAVRKVQKILVQAGHSITHDWTRAEPAPATARESTLAQHAIDDHHGVRDADCYVGLFEKDLRYRGAFGEMGIAIGCGKPIILIGPHCKKFVFSYHPLVIAWYDSIEEFLHNQKIFRYAGEVKIKEV